MKFDIEKKGYKKSEVDEYIFALKNEYESRLSDQKNRIFQLKSELVDKEKQLSSYKEKTDLIATAILNAVAKADEIEKLSAARYREEMNSLRVFHDKWQAHYNKLLEQRHERYFFGRDKRYKGNRKAVRVRKSPT